MSQAEKDRSRQRIVSAASRRARAHGLSGASIADVMGEAGLTHGGFYKHFDSKDAMIEAALAAAFNAALARFGSADHAGDEATRAFTDAYLSPDHRHRPNDGCPIPALAADIGRGSLSLRTAFGQGVRAMVARLAAGFGGTREARERRAMRHLAMLAGAILIARASDEDTAHAVLAACADRANAPDEKRAGGRPA